MSRGSVRITYFELIELVPEMGELLDRARAIKDPGFGDSYCIDDVRTEMWDEVQRLVGPENGGGADDHRPQYTVAALELSGRALRAALPSCRNCGCSEV